MGILDIFRKKSAETPLTEEQEYRKNAEKRFDAFFEFIENLEGVQSVKLKNDQDRVIPLDGFPARLEKAAQQYDKRADKPEPIPTPGEKPEYPEMSDPEDDRASADLYREFARIAEERMQVLHSSKENLKAA